LAINPTGLVAVINININIEEENIMLCSIGKIEEKQLDEIRSLEEELGKTILAFQCGGETKPAALDEKQLQRIRDLEEKLHLTLVAVEY